MKKTTYPFVALGLGLFLMAILLAASHTVTPDGKPPLSLLTLLLISEFGFISCAIGAWIGIKSVKLAQRKVMMILTSFACAAMSIRFMLLGIEFWPL